MIRRAALLGLALVAAACKPEPREQADAGPSGADTPPSFERAAGDPERGRRIFTRGESPSGAEITALLAGDVEIPAATMPCVGCHGDDGLGRPEGGMKPSNITWEVLSKPYGGRGGDGREHAAYDLAGLGKAITTGIDPSGNELQRTMPRYRMSRRDLDDLVAYVRVLGDAPAVGVDDDSIALLTILPADDPGAELVEAVLRAYVHEINARGGSFGRTLELEVLRVSVARADSVEQAGRELEAALARRPPFAVLAPRLGEAEAELLGRLADAGVPVIGPATNYPDPGSPPRPSVFYVDGGIPAQALSLARLAIARAKAQALRTAVVVHADDPRERALAHQVLELWAQAGLDGRAVELADAAAEPDPLDADVALFLGPAAAVGPSLERAAAAGEVPKLVLLPGALAIGDPFALPAALDDRVLLAYPWIPDDLDPKALRDYQTLAEAHDLPTAGRPVQLAALTAGALLLEGLARSGRDLTRARLIETLEQLSEYDTGLTPPLDYGPNRRIGLREARIVAVDLDGHRLEPVATR